MADQKLVDVVVVGGGPAGATAAADLAGQGLDVVLLDREGRIKPCGGAVPPRAIDEFKIPESLLVSRVHGARIVSPKDKQVAMPVGQGYVGMVDRMTFDPWLRERAEAAGARRITGTFERLEPAPWHTSRIHYRPDGGARGGEPVVIHTRAVIGADGANSAVARQALPEAKELPHVFAYHEIVESPPEGTPGFDPDACDVIYQGSISPDFYGWVFPHGATTSVGTGSAHKGFALRQAVADIRRSTGLADQKTLRREGAPIPLRPLPRWDDGRNVLLAGDAAGVVAPASGEGIFYAMTGGRLAAEAIGTFLREHDLRALGSARRRFMRAHGAVFWMLGIMQRYWYSNDDRRERFVTICRDKDVQELTWDAYMNKELVKAKPLAHLKIFTKNLAHLSGLVPA